MNEDRKQNKWLHPESTSDVVTMVHSAHADSCKLRICGCTPMTLEESGVRCMTLNKMCGVVDYPARDMTITVQAGMPIAELTKILAAENQQLPIDVFNTATSVGAAVAGDFSGPRQFGYSTMRDYVIGIEAVDGQGRVFHAGGRVVKNVAGYDLCRLMVGSRGVLGVLTQVTFKLKPKPQTSMLAVFRFDDLADLDTTLERLHTSAATPVVLDFSVCAIGQQENNGSHLLTIGVEGTEVSCRWQIEQLKRECELGSFQNLNERGGESLAQHCLSWGYGWNEPMIRCRPSQVVPIASAVAAEGHSCVGHAGSGKLFVIGRSGGDNLRHTCEKIAKAHGGAVTEWEHDHPMNQTDQLTVRIRSALDPNGTFIA